MNEKATLSCVFFLSLNGDDRIFLNMRRSEVLNIAFINRPHPDSTRLGRRGRNQVAKQTPRKQQVVRMTSRLQFPSRVLGVARELELS